MIGSMGRMNDRTWGALLLLAAGCGEEQSDDGLFGDVDPGAMELAAYMTPVPGGVGPMTIAMVLKNTVTAARSRRGLVSRSH
jgi:5,10-methylene-tetrahydrofolate dehydrogenase/methenyl tetrahydrofolate cyclohydrolase